MNDHVNDAMARILAIVGPKEPPLPSVPLNALLARCPFCGRPADVDYDEDLSVWRLGCHTQDCFAEMPRQGDMALGYDDPKEAIERWNHRANNALCVKTDSKEKGAGE